MAWVNRSTGLAPAQNQWWRTFSISSDEIAIVYQPLGADNLAASLVNLVNPGTNDAVAIVDPTFATGTGWTFDGSQHLTTNLTGNGLQTIMVRFEKNFNADMTIIGNTGGQSTFLSVSVLGGSFLSDFKYNTTTTAGSFTNAGDMTVALARNKIYAQGALDATVGTLDSWAEGDILIAQAIFPGSVRFTGDIKAFVVYNRELTAEEIINITNNMNTIVSTDDPTPDPHPVNWLIQNPSTKHLNNTSHELWAATDDGLFRTFDGGRGWAKIPLLDPSNAEFGDSPAAIISELTFHQIIYDRSDKTILYALGAKGSTSRIWIYKATNSGVNVSDWSSRGVTW